MFFYAAVILILIAYFYSTLRKWARKCKSTKRMDRKVVLITGGTAGIGKYTALDLAKRGAKIILPCRDIAKGNSVADWIKEKSGNKEIFVYKLDISNLSSVNSFSAEILRAETKIDVLVNNAGCVSAERKLTPQGFELTFATNHLGHFLLTLNLIGLLEKSSQARIINVSSYAHARTFNKESVFDLNDLQFEKRKYSFWQAYSQSKLCNILFTNELATRIKQKGMKAFSLHPGNVFTSISTREKTLLNFLFTAFNYIIGKSEEDGAQTTIYLAVSDEVENLSGEYFTNCKISQKSKDGQDEVLGKELWKVSEKLVKREF